jgi:hypothetical protein
MKLDLTNTDLKNAISEAILSQISADAREEILREAMKYVLEPGMDNYGRNNGPSKLQQSFRQSVALLTDEIIGRLVREDPQIKATIEDFAKTAITSLMRNDSDRAKIADAFSEAFRKVLTGERR